MKKLFFMVGILFAWVLAGMAQVNVEVVVSQRQFLPNESMPVAVRITNRSGQQLHFGEEPNWLTFSIESEEGADVVKNGEPAVQGAFDLESSQMGTKRVDLGPCFTLTKAGRYKIVATVRLKDWGSEIVSLPTFIDVIKGTPLWSQDFGLPTPDNATKREPELRNFSLIKVSYLTAQLRLYVQVSNAANGQVYKVTAVGPLVSFSDPEAQVDPQGNLHVLYQSGASIFSYDVIDPGGNPFEHELYDYVTKHPRLGVNDQGEITVIGGVRRLKSDEMPMVKMPSEVTVPVRH